MFSRSSMLCLALILSAACTDVATEDGDPERGSLGKADALGWCEPSSCGGPGAVGDCYCDDICIVYDDCCNNYEDVCDPEQGGDGTIFCGGIANLHCPSGLTCVPDGPSSDAGGHCVWED